MNSTSTFIVMIPYSSFSGTGVKCVSKKVNKGKLFDNQWVDNCEVNSVYFCSFVFSK
jgi:hypothetical protein